MNIKRIVFPLTCTEYLKSKHVAVIDKVNCCSRFISSAYTVYGVIFFSYFFKCKSKGNLRNSINVNYLFAIYKAIINNFCCICCIYLGNNVSINFTCFIYKNLLRDPSGITYNNFRVFCPG